VTILALGGLLLPLLRDAGFPERRGIGLVTSASALGVLLAPSVPLIMYAIIARVPINAMFLAGVLPAVVMVAFLLVIGGYLKRGRAWRRHRLRGWGVWVSCRSPQPHGARNGNFSRRWWRSAPW
jgi:TRAP-type C4-dicarboxylate transport system permease large subunit